MLLHISACWCQVRAAGLRVVLSGPSDPPWDWKKCPILLSVGCRSSGWSVRSVWSLFSLSTGGRNIESEGLEVRMVEGFTRSLPSSPLLNLRLAKRPGGTDWLIVYLSVCLSIKQKYSIMSPRYNQYTETWIHTNKTYAHHRRTNRWQSLAKTNIAASRHIHWL